MKKILLIISLLIATTGYTAEPWRTLTLTNVGGFTLGGSYYNTFSLTLFYELDKRWSIESWSGANYNYTYNNGWLSTQNTINKGFGTGWTVGTGFLYGGGATGAIINEAAQKDMILIFTVSKRFKLP